MTELSYHDSFGYLAQAGGGCGLQLVRITGLAAGNRYAARAVEFDDNGATQLADTSSITVTNLAEPSDQAGQLAAGVEAVAMDLEGRWVIFVRLAPAVGGTTVFPARLVSSQGSAAYTVKEQSATGAGTFADKSGATNITAYNLAELTLGPGAALDTGTVVMVLTMTDIHGDTRYVFDHPTYAKYLT